MQPELILSFLGTSVLLTLMPGPDNIFVLTESLTKGSKNGLAIALGLSSGVLIHTLAAALGLSVIIQQSELVFTIIKFFGVAYLLYLAWLSYKEKPDNTELSQTTTTQTKVPWFRFLRKGFLMNVLNPKVSLFFIAFLPQFVSQDGSWSPSVQMIALGVVFMLQTVVIFGGVAILSGKLSTFLNSPKFWNTTKYLKIIVLLGLSVFLAL